MKIGFIGCGNMGSAMIRGILAKGAAAPDEIMAVSAGGARSKALSDELGIVCGKDAAQAAGFADILFLAVKPQQFPAVAPAVKSVLDGREKITLVSMAPGYTLADLAERFGDKHDIVRIMPNTPALVGEAMTGICPAPGVPEEKTAQVEQLCRAFGEAERVSEKLLDTVTAVSGSSPAYVFMMIEAMADGAVLEGMPRAQAYRFAAQAVLGSAKMALETGAHPGDLKDRVCSPGGTTIEAVRVLEEKGLRSALIEAERACAEKSRAMAPGKSGK